MAKSYTGVVKSNKTDKTIVVIVQTEKNHPIYRKQYVDSRNFMAHDENNEAEIGDRVRILETRPISARKRFKLDIVLEKPLLRQADTAVTEVQTPVVDQDQRPEGAKQ